MDIIVTTPKSERANAVREASACIADGGGRYFRRFPGLSLPRTGVRDRVYYVEDGYIRGFGVVTDMAHDGNGRLCSSTGRWWPKGLYLFMDAQSWTWIRPIPMRGFQGFRYAHYRYGGQETREWLTIDGKDWAVTEVGGWLDPKPATPDRKETNP